MAHGFSQIPCWWIDCGNDYTYGQVAIGNWYSLPVEVIISGDEDLLILKEFQEIPILTTKQFLENYQFTDTDID